MTTILGLISRRDRPTAALLGAALAARGARLVPLITETFPGESQLDATLGPGGFTGSLTTQDGVTVELSDIHSIWMKRWDVGAELAGGGLDRSVAHACRREAEAVLRGVLTGIDAPMVSDMAAVERAECKVWQLREAVRLGLSVPPTWLGNRPGQGAGFHDAHGPLITKRMSTSLVRSPSGARRMMYTAAVGAEDVAALDGGLHLAPATLQARVDKDIEVRAVVVGTRVFASAVASQDEAGAEVDWRQRSDRLMARFTPVALPPALVDQLVALHQHLGLAYGGADLIRTPDGDWVFLETNPCGEWDWIHESGHDVAGALATLLLEAR